MNYRELANKYGTPLYVYDFNHIKEQFNEFKNAFKAKKSLICYAVKANSNLSVLKYLKEMGAGCDCVSIGEVNRALKVGVPKYKIIYSGVGKRDDEIRDALKNDILMINIESEEEAQRVEFIAKELGVKARISIRINPNIDAKTHSYISTGLYENKFGVDVESAKKMYIKAQKSKYLTPIGIHFHIGSQITNIEPFCEAVKVVSSFVRSLKSLKIDIKFFNVGGGVGIDYRGEETINIYDYSKVIFENLTGLDVTITCEPGRFLVGNSGKFLTKVLYEKRSSKKRFIITDGAMNDLGRPSLYSAYHDIEVIGSQADVSKADVVGPVCESSDFFAKDRELPKTKHNDLLVIKSAGAYCFTMSSNYNTRAKVAEVALINGKDKLIRKRDNFNDMIQNEITCI
ncbi:MAG: diaminopimelate decarboxylase [Sulfurospirillum sp.]|nr:diaminopimelate decarboxylase [Sulfurospirillum sp.]MBL0702479.1 diaminopimelate decarboxylase [Sulfurospirillum sp.]